MKIDIQLTGNQLPSYETGGSAGMDIRAAISEPMVIEPGDRALVPSGIRVALPPGYEAQIRARSGLAIKYGIGLVNGIGTIDSDYRGEILIPLINWGKEPFTIHSGDRIAQMVVMKYEHIQWEIVETLSSTQRGAGGFGHTGHK